MPDVNVFFLLLLFLGAVLFFVDFIGWNRSRFNLTAGGLLCWILVPLITLLNTYV